MNKDGVKPSLSRRFYAWTGIGAYYDADNKRHRGKTLWEWMDLLIVPVVLAGAAIGLAMHSSSTERRAADRLAEIDREIAAERAREETHRQYFDHIEYLLLHHGLATADSDSVVRAVARARTLTTLRQLDGGRRGEVVRFLYEADLIVGDHDIPSWWRSNPGSVSLHGADLTGVDLTGAYLPSVDLQGADLTDGRLTGAKLRNASLHWSVLVRADLSRTDLVGASLSSADLRGANLSMAALGRCINDKEVLALLTAANLADANLRGAAVTHGQVTTAKTISGAILDERLLQSACPTPAHATASPFGRPSESFPAGP